MVNPFANQVEELPNEELSLIVKFEEHNKANKNNIDEFQRTLNASHTLNKIINKISKISIQQTQTGKINIQLITEFKSDEKETLIMNGEVNYLPQSKINDIFLRHIQKGLGELMSCLETSKKRQLDNLKKIAKEINLI